MKLVSQIVVWFVDPLINHFFIFRVLIAFVSMILICSLLVRAIQRQMNLNIFLFGLMGLFGLLFVVFYKPILFWLVGGYAYTLLAFSFLTIILTLTVCFRLLKRQFNITTFALTVTTLFFWLFVVHYWTHIPGGSALPPNGGQDDKIENR